MRTVKISANKAHSITFVSSGILMRLVFCACGSMSANGSVKDRVHAVVKSDRSPLNTIFITSQHTSAIAKQVEK